LIFPAGFLMFTLTWKPSRLVWWTILAGLAFDTLFAFLLPTLAHIAAAIQMNRETMT
jgi:hypothetical protein